MYKNINYLDLVKNVIQYKIQKVSKSYRNYDNKEPASNFFVYIFVACLAPCSIIFYKL